MWQDPEEGRDTGHFLTKLPELLTLLRHELLGELSENCKEASKQTGFKLFLQILYSTERGQQWQQMDWKYLSFRITCHFCSVVALKQQSLREKKRKTKTCSLQCRTREKTLEIDVWSRWTPSASLKSRVIMIAAQQGGHSALIDGVRT